MVDTKTSKDQSHQKKYYVPVSYARVCECCGKEFIAHNSRKRFCKKSCADAKRRPYDEIKKRCVECGKEFITKRRAVITCSTYCSKRHHNSPGKSILKKRCIVCGKEFETPREDRKTCGDKECQRKNRDAHGTRPSKKPPAVKIVSKTCVICGEDFKDYPNGTIKTCSSKCSKELAKTRWTRKADKRIPKGQRVDCISLKALYRRDKGKCYLCGGYCDWSDWRISKNGNRYPGDYYPTRDHVVPVSKGGLDSWENVRLAHWKCNLEKADGVIKIRPMSKTLAYSEKYNSGKKKTEQYSLQGELIKVWESTADIKRTLGLNDKRIQDVCRGNGKTAFGYIWKYA